MPEVLVLLHGIGASAERWVPVFPGLSEKFEVIIPDIIGFGYSDKPTVEYTMDFFVEFLDKFMKSLYIKQASLYWIVIRRVSSHRIYDEISKPGK